MHTEGFIHRLLSQMDAERLTLNGVLQNKVREGRPRPLLSQSLEPSVLNNVAPIHALFVSAATSLPPDAVLVFPFLYYRTTGTTGDSAPPELQKRQPPPEAPPPPFPLTTRRQQSPIAPLQPALHDSSTLLIPDIIIPSFIYFTINQP